MPKICDIFSLDNKGVNVEKIGWWGHEEENSPLSSLQEEIADFTSCSKVNEMAICLSPSPCPVLLYFFLATLLLKNVAS